MGADGPKERSTGARGPGQIGFTAQHTCAGHSDADPHCPSRRCGHSYADRYDHVDAGNTVTLTHGNQYADIDTHVHCYIDPNPYSDGNPFTHSDGDQDRQAIAHPDTDAASHRETDTASHRETDIYADAAANRKGDAGAYQEQARTLAQA
jgi:hypothetical protein